MIITFGKKVLMTKEKADKIFFSLYLFILVFAPPLIPYPHLFLTIFSFLSLVTTYRAIAWSIFKRSGIFSWALTMFLLAAYTVCVPLPISMLCNDIVNTSHYISVINRYGVLVVAVSVCVTYLLCKIDRMGYDYKILLEGLINAGLIEGICATLAFLFPSIKNVFIFFMRRFSESRLYSNTWYITVRSYGFASTLVDVFGLGIGIIAGICFFYGIVGKKTYIIKSVIIAIATILNSRTGLLIYLIAIVLSILYVGKKGNIKKIVTTFAAIGIISFLGTRILKIMSTNEYTAGWFQSGIKSMINFLNGKNLSSSNNDELGLLFQKNFWNFPPFPRIIFGTGHSLYGANGYAHSDVGYVNELWLFGVIGCLLLYGKIFEMCSTMRKKAFNPMFEYAAVFLLTSYFFFNIKGAALGYNPGAVSMFIIIFLGKYQIERCKEKENGSSH